jgi:hypothetical protein
VTVSPRHGSAQRLRHWGHARARHPHSAAGVHVGIHGLSIDTIELYESNMIDELALRLVHRNYR